MVSRDHKMDPSEVEFAAENVLVKIVPKFSENKLQLLHVSTNDNLSKHSLQTRRFALRVFSLFSLLN